MVTLHLMKRLALVVQISPKPSQAAAAKQLGREGNEPFSLGVFEEARQMDANLH